MHYIANAKYWHDMANGLVERRAYDPDPVATFASHCILGVVPFDLSAREYLAMPWSEARARLELRTPLLQGAYRMQTRDVEQLAATLC